MAKTNAQRQAEYRKRAYVSNGEYRVNTWISAEASQALDRLSCRYSVTKREMLEKLLEEADNKVVKKLELDSDEWNEYFCVTQ